MNIIEIKNLSKVYSSRQGEVKALDNINLTVKEGEFISVVGSSGSGKSTLMNIVGLLDTASFGEYYIIGKSVSQFDQKGLAEIRNKYIGFIFQDFNLIGSLTAKENILLPLIYRGLNKKEREYLAEEVLYKVGLSERKHHLPSELSGGQRQRVAVARAIVGNPPLLLADEPTGNLDPQMRDEMLSLFCSLSNSGHTVIIITHDFAVADCAKRQIIIQNGKMKE